MHNSVRLPLSSSRREEIKKYGLDGKHDDMDNKIHAV